MIQKVLPRITNQPIRSILKHNTSGLKCLAGSSMSGWHGPSFQPVEMIIPGGLDFKEKAFFLLKGKLPKSVYERWMPNDGENVVGTGDQLVTIQKSGQYVGDIIENPHDYIGGNELSSLDTGIHDIANGDLTDIAGASGDGDDVSVFEIFKHLGGFQ